MQADAIGGGFARPVFEAQAMFRAIMDAMAQPGSVQPCDASVLPPAPLTPTAAAVALTLCDQDTPVWLDAPLAASAAAAAWLGFHSGARIVADRADAQFALVADPAHLPDLSGFAQGSQDYPDRSATLILQLDTLTEGSPLVLRGPGIEVEARLAPAPLPAQFSAFWQRNGASFPRGVDLILVAPDGVAALPRTTRIETGKA